MYTYTRVIEVTIDEKEYIKDCKEWDIEPPKTEEEMREALISHFEEWTSNDFWEVTHGYRDPHPYIKDYYEHTYAEKRRYKK